MLSSRRLLEMARKWKRIATSGRKRISSMNFSTKNDDTCNKLVADKGYFVVYTSEGKRFMVPLAFLGSRIFEELLKVSEEEFGLPTDGPIALPCDAAFLNFVLSILRRGPKDSEDKLFMPICTTHCLRLLFNNAEQCQQVAVF